MALGIALGALNATGCVSSDSVITCQDLDDYLYDCSYDCAATYDCEYEYDSLTLDDQLLMDDCAACLADNSGTCSDCTVDDGVGTYSCFDLVTDYLGMDCFY
jgi:hypothetical protein